MAVHRARKNYVCSRCGAIIKKGTLYQIYTLNKESIKRCRNCAIEKDPTPELMKKYFDRLDPISSRSTTK